VSDTTDECVADRLWAWHGRCSHAPLIKTRDESHTLACLQPLKPSGDGSLGCDRPDTASRPTTGKKYLSYVQ